MKIKPDSVGKPIQLTVYENGELKKDLHTIILGIDTTNEKLYINAGGTNNSFDFKMIASTSYVLDIPDLTFHKFKFKIPSIKMIDSICLWKKREPNMDEITKSYITSEEMVSKINYKAMKDHLERYLKKEKEGVSSFNDRKAIKFDTAILKEIDILNLKSI